MAMSRLSVVFVASACFTLAQAGSVDTQVARFRTFFMTPGAAVAVVKDGKVVFARGYGLANAEEGTKVRPDTVFRIASVSKQFIAAGILILEQDRKLSVEDKVSKYIPDVPPEWGEITLRHLMNHTSGLQRESPAFKGFENSPLIDQIRAGFTAKLVFPTGTKYQYCNLGYFILAHIIESVSGQNWGEFMQARIFRPLGMTRTGVTDEIAIIPNRARAYRHQEGKLVNVAPWTALRPSGAFVSTVLDMAKWDAALYTEEILSNASKAKMWAPTSLTDGTKIEYGFGWDIVSDNGHPIVYHDGGLVGFSTNFSRYINDRLTVITFLNEMESPARALTQRIAALYIPALASPQPKRIADTEPEMTALVAKYLRSRIAEKPDTSIMTEEFLKQVNWPVGRARFTGFGDLVSLSPLDPTGLEAPYTHRYEAKFRKITLTAMAAVKEGKLSVVGVSLD